MNPGRSLTLSGVLACLGWWHGYALAAEPPEGVCTELWAVEHAIFDGRARGEMSDYLGISSDALLTWPIVVSQPVSGQAMRARYAAGLPPGERVALQFRGCTANGNTAIMYFTTHRTRTSEGLEVDEYFDYVHVFSLEDDDWRLIGSKSRRAAPPSDVLAGRNKAVCGQLWEMEQQIFVGRAQGDRSYYLSIASPAYIGWPPQYTEPVDYAELRAGLEQQGVPGERIDMTLRGCSVDGDTAVIFYSTHRTRRAGGAPADERFETIHIYTQRDGRWLMMGAMARPEPER